MKTANIILWMALLGLATKNVHAYDNQVIVDCLSFSGNKGKYLIKTFFADTSQGWRTQPLRGECTPGTLQVHKLKERIGYAWIKGESTEEAIFRVTSQQNYYGYKHESWSYKNADIFIVTSKRNPSSRFSLLGTIQNIGPAVVCDGNDGRDKNGYCQLRGLNAKTFKTTPPYTGTVQNIALPTPSYSFFSKLVYTGITKVGRIYRQYWDYRNGKWNSDNCFTFTAYFLDDHSFEVTCPLRDFTSQDNAKTKAEGLLSCLGKVPKFTRSWLKTLAINGDGTGSRAGANSHRKSMNLNMANWIIKKCYTLFLHEGAHVALLSIQNSAKWKKSQKLDPGFISTYAKASAASEDVPESFVPWMLAKHHPLASQVADIKATIPNRLNVFDDLICTRFLEFPCNPLKITKFNNLPTGINKKTYVTHAFVIKDEKTMKNVALFQTKSLQKLVNSFAERFRIYLDYLPNGHIGIKFLNFIQQADAIVINNSDQITRMLLNKSIKSSYMRGDKGFILQIKNLTDKTFIACWVDNHGNQVLLRGQKIHSAPQTFIK